MILDLQELGTSLDAPLFLASGSAVLKVRARVDEPVQPVFPLQECGVDTLLAFSELGCLKVLACVSPASMTPGAAALPASASPGLGSPQAPFSFAAVLSAVWLFRFGYPRVSFTYDKCS